MKNSKTLIIFIGLLFFINLSCGVFNQKSNLAANTPAADSMTSGKPSDSPAANSTLLLTLSSQEKSATLEPGSSSPFYIFVGDSLTEGKGSNGWENRYPSQAMAIIGSNNFINLGVGGARISDLITRLSTNIDQLVNPSHQFVLMVWVGPNDLIADNPKSTFTKELSSYWQDRRAAGFKVIAFTVLPVDRLNIDQENERVAYNDWIRANWATYCDALVDVASVPELQDPTNSTYFRGDRVHLTIKGYKIVAQLAAPEMSKMK